MKVVLLQINFMRVLVSDLSLSGDQTNRPGDHVARFGGDEPCDRDGRPLTTLINSAIDEYMSGGIHLRYLFSRKSEERYRDYHHLMTTYIAVLQSVTSLG